MSMNALEQARTVARPTRADMLARDPSVHAFWNRNDTLFEAAWREWEADDGQQNPPLDRSLYAPDLRAAIEQSWETPDAEGRVRDLWTEVFPGVFEAQFFDPERLKDLRAYLDRVADAGIPMRPPYGIVLNRGGAMLDPRSEGYLAAPAFQTFYRDLMDRYMRPISRLLFPDSFGYDTQTFGFSIQWQAGKDTTLRPHTDASAVTLNINLNSPGESYAGSAVRFFDQTTGEVESLTFEPGRALIHHGSVPHASEPIIEGERRNFVFWLYGDRGQVPQPGAPVEPKSPQDRWTVPPMTSDGIAPF
ncbi:MAG: 2OG-Fe(II) oxygenase [Pseudomonadota bacterium]